METILIANSVNRVWMETSAALSVKIGENWTVSGPKTQYIGQIHRMYNAKSEHTTLVGDADKGAGYACEARRCMGKSPHLTFNFAVNIKLL